MHCVYYMYTNTDFITALAIRVRFISTSLPSGCIQILILEYPWYSLTSTNNCLHFKEALFHSVISTC